MNWEPSDRVKDIDLKRPSMLLDASPIIDESEHIIQTPTKTIYIYFHVTGIILEEITDHLKSDSSEVPQAVDGVQDVLQDLKWAVGNLEGVISDVQDMNGKPLAEIATQLESALDRAQTTVSRLNGIQETHTTDRILESLSEAQTKIERAQTRLKPPLSHQSFTDDCTFFMDWDDFSDVQVTTNLALEGNCMICGKQYEEIFQRSGIYDQDRGYVYEP